MSNIVTKVLRHLPNTPLIAVWLVQRRSLKRYFSDSSLPDFSTAVAESVGLRQQQEDRLTQILSRHSGGAFAEIGIGPQPNLPRHAMLAKNDISYTGVDFSSVCALHAKAIKDNGLHRPDIELIGNTCGTYAWNLAKMASDRRMFDAIYFDGHHTFYVDLPAAILATRLVRPGGTLIFDDYLWTMSLLARNMHASFPAWKFYRKMYDFSQYDSDQIATPHIKMIVDDILIKDMGFRRDEALSLPGWIVLTAP